MVLLTILTITALLLIGIVVATVCVGGAAFIVVFGDVIVCVVFIALIIKLIIKRRIKRRRR